MTCILIDIANSALHCTGCQYSGGPWIDGLGSCSVFDEKWNAVHVSSKFDPVMMRHQKCLAAEQRHTRMVEAGEAMSHVFCPDDERLAAWNRAILREEEK